MVSEGVIRRFWPKVKVGGPDDCWEWQASCHNGGYGQMGAGKAGEGVLRAHRVSFELHFGPVPDGHFVCHKCDNPKCVNPVHLYAGTPADNMRDRKARGRATGGRLVGTVPSGARSPNAKLTEADAIQIIKSADTLRVLAQRFGISETQVHKIRTGKQWRHLGGKERNPRHGSG